jgi:hypothetical protein
MAEANQATEHIARAINARAHQVKAMAARDLLRSLDAARTRFETEVRGFTDLVTQDLADLQRLDREEGSFEDNARVGSFRYRPRVNAGALKLVERGQLHDQLVGLWSRALTLRSIPDRIPLSDHAGILQSLASHSDERDLASQQVEDATEVFEKAVRYATDPLEHSLVELPHYDLLAGKQGRVFAVVGHQINSRIDSSSLDEINPTETELLSFVRGGQHGAPSDSEETRAVLGAMAPEVAVIHSVRSLKIPHDKEGAT